MTQTEAFAVRLLVHCRMKGSARLLVDTARASSWTSCGATDFDDHCAGDSYACDLHLRAAIHVSRSDAHPKASPSSRLLSLSLQQPAFLLMLRGRHVRRSSNDRGLTNCRCKSSDSQG